MPGARRGGGVATRPEPRMEIPYLVPVRVFLCAVVQLGPRAPVEGGAGCRILQLYGYDVGRSITDIVAGVLLSR